MRSLLVCIHDAAPVHRSETVAMLRDLRPLIGRSLSIAVVPDWHGAWPLQLHQDYCALVRDSAAELLLHGYQHRRRRGHGPVTLLAGSDEMNGLDAAATRATLERGQDVFREVFGAPARGFLAPAWQRGHVRPGSPHAPGLDYVLGYFSVQTSSGGRARLATATWDCGRWSALGHIGDGLGRVLRSDARRVPVVAIHPRDLESGFWPRVLRLIRQLLDAGYVPATPWHLLEETGC